MGKARKKARLDPGQDVPKNWDRLTAGELGHSKRMGQLERRFESAVRALEDHAKHATGMKERFVSIIRELLEVY